MPKPLLPTIHSTMGSMQLLGGVNMLVRQKPPGVRIPKELLITIGETMDLTLGLTAWRTVSTRIHIAPNL